MFGNGTQNNNQQSQNQSGNQKDPGTTIRIRSFFGETASMALSFWNEKLSIKMNPLSGVSADGVRQYDFNRKVSTALSPEKCSALLKIIEEEMEPVIKEVSEKNPLTKPLSAAAQVGANHVIVAIEYKNDEKEIPFYYLTVYTNVQDTTLTTTKEFTYTYKFNKAEVIIGYDYETGNKETKVVESEFEFFKEKMKQTAAGMSPAIKNEPTSNQNGGNGNGYRNNGYRNNYTQNNQQVAPTNAGYQAPVTEFSGTEEYLPF